MGVRKIPTKNDKPVTIEEIRELQSKGYSIAQIAEKTNISRQAIYAKIKAENKKRGELTIVDEAVRKLANPSTREIAMKMGDEKVSRFVQYHVDLFKMGQGVDKKNVADLQERFTNYLQYCIEYGIVPNNMSAYLAMGVTWNDLNFWRQGVRGTPEHKRFAEEIAAFFASIHEQGGTDGVMNPIQTIFWQKAYDGLSDQPKIEVQVNDPLGDKRTAQDIAEKYSEVELPD